MAKIDFKTPCFDENQNPEFHFRTLKEVFETIQPQQVNEFIGDFHKVLRDVSEARAKSPALKFKGFKWKPNR